MIKRIFPNLNRKKILISGLGLAGFAMAVVGMSAFEAHIINVTATIENAVNVDSDAIDFGTVYPQEELDQTFAMELSQSFLAQDRVDAVSYLIRQKPKCYSESLEQYGLVSEDENGEFFCADGGDFEILPLLCPYLSKHEITADGDTENDSDGINAFHGPLTGWNASDTIESEVAGELNRTTDPDDRWDIDMKAPCFAGSCAQDWPDFVHASNPAADPEAYKLPDYLSGELLGCDLWVEVNYIGGDESAIGAKTLFSADNYGTPDNGGGVFNSTFTAQSACTDNDGDLYNAEGGLCGPADCADDNASVNPEAAEICDDGIDNDCSGNADCEDINCTLDPACLAAPTCTDLDGDGYGTGDDRSACTFSDEDCNDADLSVHPNTTEICNDGIDNDCSGNADCEDINCLADPVCILAP